MGCSSVQSAAAVRLVCLDGVGSCVVSFLARVLSPLFPLGVFWFWVHGDFGDSWGHFGDGFDIWCFVGYFFYYFSLGLNCSLFNLVNTFFWFFFFEKKKYCFLRTGRQLLGAIPL